MHNTHHNPTILHPYQQTIYPPRSYSHHELHNAQKSHTSINNNSNGSNNNNVSVQNSRIRVHSFQQHHHQNNNNHYQSIIKKRQQKILKYKQSNIIKQQALSQLSSCSYNHNSSQFKQSNGIMNQPPDYIQNKYTFKNDEQQILKRDGTKECGMFYNCCSMIKESQREVFLSPTQLITMRYFVPAEKQELKSLKINNNSKSHAGSVNNSQQHKSFFKDNNNH